MLQSSSGRPRMGMCLPSTHVWSRNRLLSVFRQSIPYQSRSLSNELQDFLNNSFSAFRVFQTPPFAPVTCDPTVLLNRRFLKLTKPDFVSSARSSPKSPMRRASLPTLPLHSLSHVFIHHYRLVFPVCWWTHRQRSNDRLSEHHPTTHVWLRNRFLSLFHQTISNLSCLPSNLAKTQTSAQPPNLPLYMSHLAVDVDAPYIICVTASFKTMSMAVNR